MRKGHRFKVYPRWLLYRTLGMRCAGNNREPYRNWLYGGGKWGDSFFTGTVTHKFYPKERDHKGRLNP